MVNEIISDLIKIEIANVFQFEKNGEILLYHFESDLMFDNKNYGGYIRQIKSTKIIDRNVNNWFKTDYKLVLFFDPKKCLDDIKTIIAGVELTKRIGDITGISVNTFYLDSVQNMKQERLKGYLNKKVVVVDISVNEIICKKTINC